MDLNCCGSPCLRVADGCRRHHHTCCCRQVEGAVYKPALEIVPLAALPPAIPLTLQFIAVELVPVTVAVNCAVPPNITVALCGAMVTLTLLGRFGFNDDAPVNPHPVAPRTANAMSARVTLLDISRVLRFCSRIRRHLARSGPLRCTPAEASAASRVNSPKWLESMGKAAK